MKENIIKKADEIKEKLWSIRDYIYHNPELGNYEFKAVHELTEFLKQHDFIVHENLIDKKTAFKAEYKSSKEGPNVAILCEYDALPEVGHGCGHNMIGTIGAGAGVLLREVIDEIGGTVTVLGTPAEECDGAKVEMVNRGVFDDIDVAMMVHPSDRTYSSGTSLAIDALQFEFTGKASHAASEPEMGINALDAAITLFNGINALRQHLKSDVRIHGIIKEGGVAANIVPDRAVAQFYVRARERAELDNVVKKVINIAKGAELITGAKVKISNYEISYDDMKTNEALSKAFNDNLRALGIREILPPSESLGSVDMGNVSHVVPAIHPYIGLECPGVAGHSREFAAATITSLAHERLIIAAEALALTAYDVIKNKELLRSIKEEFGK